MARIKTARCQISGKEFPLNEVIPADLVRESLLEELKKEVQNWDPEGYVSIEELNKARMRHVEQLLEGEQGELQRLQRVVYRSLQQHETLSRNIDLEYDTKAALGERLADRIAAFGGSWRFIILFLAIIVIWMIVNTVAVLRQPFDPYPFILLNLVLSCLAALQAPVIMMSQNRQEAKDRLRSEHDYKINLKAELEIRHINEKIDRLLNEQWKHLLEIQQMQMEMIEEMHASQNNGRKPQS